MIVQTLSRYGLDRSVAAPWPKGAPMGVVLATMWRTARLSGRVSQYWSFFDPAYLFLTGGFANVVNSTRHVGVFPMSFVALVPIGVAALVWRRRPVVDALVLAAFVTAPLAACLAVPEPYAIDRELELLPFGVLIAVAGARHLLTTHGRASRAAGMLLLAAVPLHFAFFSVDYYRDYPRGAAFWFNWNSRDAIAEVIALEPRFRPATIYLSTHHVSNLEAYWRFYVRRYGREDLLKRAVSFDSEGFDVASIQPGSLLLVGRDDTALTPSLDAGILRRLATIPEPADPPFFSILVRTPISTRTAETVSALNKFFGVALCRSPRVSVYAPGMMTSRRLLACGDASRSCVRVLEKRDAHDANHPVVHGHRGRHQRVDIWRRGGTAIGAGHRRHRLHLDGDEQRDVRRDHRRRIRQRQRHRDLHGRRQRRRRAHRDADHCRHDVHDLAERRRRPHARQPCRLRPRRRRSAASG